MYLTGTGRLMSSLMGDSVSRARTLGDLNFSKINFCWKGMSWKETTPLQILPLFSWKKTTDPTGKLYTLKFLEENTEEIHMTLNRFCYIDTMQKERANGAREMDRG